VAWTQGIVYSGLVHIVATVERLCVAAMNASDTRNSSAACPQTIFGNIII